LEGGTVTAEEALNSLLGANRTDDLRADLIAAAKEAMRRREQNTRDGGAVIAALIESGLSYRDIERLTGIPHVTAHRWAAPPQRVVPPSQEG
jgi:thymidine phosphorylase